jgi:hypothetical protein
MTIGAHFDGRVFVPDGPIDLPVGHRVRVVAESADGPELASPEVRDFCAAYDLGGPVSRLQALAHQGMSGLTDIELRVQTDPESGESWVVVEARIAAGSRHVLDEYKIVLQRWIEATEPQARDRICFTFAVA